MTNMNEIAASAGIPLVLSVHDIARLLNVGRNTAYDLVNSGTLKSVRVGRQIRVSRAEFCRYLGIS